MKKRKGVEDKIRHRLLPYGMGSLFYFTLVFLYLVIISVNGNAITDGWMDGWTDGWVDGWITLFRPCLYGLGYPRQPSPRATLAELTFHLFL